MQPHSNLIDFLHVVSIFTFDQCWSNCTQLIFVTKATKGSSLNYKITFGGLGRPPLPMKYCNLSGIKAKVNCKKNTLVKLLNTKCEESNL